MAKKTALQGSNVGVSKGKEPVIENGLPVFEPDGTTPQFRDVWTIYFVEVNPQTGDIISFTMGDEVRANLIRDLTGGVVLAGPGGIGHV